MGPGATAGYGTGTGDDEHSGWDRMVPPYVDDLTRPRQARGEPAGAGHSTGEPPAEDRAAAAAGGGTAGRDADSGWSAWSSARPARTEGPAGGAGRDRRRHDAAVGTAAGSELAGRSAIGGGTAADGGIGAADAAAGRPGGPPEDERAGDDRIGAGAAGPGEPSDIAVTTGTDDAEQAAGPGEARPGEAQPDLAETGPAKMGKAGPDRAEPAPAGDASDGAQAGEADHGTDADAAAAPSSGGDGEADGAGQGDEASAPLDNEVTVVPGVARYHRRGCILIRFLSDGDLETITRREAQAAGSVPCKACQPDKPGPAS